MKSQMRLELCLWKYWLLFSLSLTVYAFTRVFVQIILMDYSQEMHELLNAFAHLAFKLSFTRTLPHTAHCGRSSPIAGWYVKLNSKSLIFSHPSCFYSRKTMVFFFETAFIHVTDTFTTLMLWSHSSRNTWLILFSCYIEGPLRTYMRASNVNSHEMNV
jgi:hypothetical protein